MRSYKEYLEEASWYNNVATQSQEAEKKSAQTTAKQEKEQIVVIGDSIAVGIGGESAYAKGGISAREVLNRVKAFVATGKASGSRVILSTGASNSAKKILVGATERDNEEMPAELGSIDEQVKTLVDAGAAVAVVGVGSQMSKEFPATRWTKGKKYKVDLTGINDMLSGIASKYGAAFLGPLEKYDPAMSTNGDGIHPFNGYTKLYQAGSKVPVKTKEPATGGGAAQPAEKGPAAEEPVDQTVEKFSPEIKKIQEALLAAGFELPRYGVDGKLGPETRAAIRDAEKALGRTPTGKITVDEIKSLKDKKGTATQGGAAQPAAGGADTRKLTDALSSIEALLSKYNIKNEGIDRELVLANVNRFSLAEQFEIHKELVLEADKPKLPPGAKFDRATGNWYTQDATGKKTFLGGTGTAKPAASFSTKEPSKWASWAKKLAPSFGRAGAKAAAGGAAALTPTGIGQVAGAGLLLWSAYDIAKAVYDVATAKGLEDFSPEDQEIFTKNLEVVMKYTREPEMIKTLDADTKNRLERITKALKELGQDLEEPEQAPEPKNPFNPSGRSNKYQLTPQEAKNLLDNGEFRDIEAFGGRAKLEKIAQGK